MKTLERGAKFAWPGSEPSATDSIEMLPLNPWGQVGAEVEAKGGIYVLRRRYLRPERDVEATFKQLASVWERETLLVSSPTEAATRDSYQKIIGLGLQCVPLLLERLRESRRNYFWALDAITHQNPAEHAESVGEAIDAWMEWGRDNGYIDP
jgi:hypothetical protein